MEKEMTEEEFLTTLFGEDYESVNDAKIVVITATTKVNNLDEEPCFDYSHPGLAETVYYTAEEMWQEMEADPDNSCSDEWRTKGYEIEIIIRPDGEIEYVCGENEQHRANQPAWFTDYAHDVIEGALEGLLAICREQGEI